MRSENSYNQESREKHVPYQKFLHPWRWCGNLDEGVEFKVKLVKGKLKAGLGLQEHHQKSEHRVVVRGIPEITNRYKVILLTDNLSAYIPLGEGRRLADPRNVPLEIVEVQSGCFRGDGDLVRCESHSWRSEK